MLTVEMILNHYKIDDIHVSLSIQVFHFNFVIFLPRSLLSFENSQFACAKSSDWLKAKEFLKKFLIKLWSFKKKPVSIEMSRWIASPDIQEENWAEFSLSSQFLTKRDFPPCRKHSFVAQINIFPNLFRKFWKLCGLFSKKLRIKVQENVPTDRIQTHLLRFLFKFSPTLTNCESLVSANKRTKRATLPEIQSWVLSMVLSVAYNEIVMDKAWSYLRTMD